MSWSGFKDKRTGDQTTANCLIMGHNLKNTGVTEGLFYEEQVPFTSTRRRAYFRGEMLYCINARCEFQQFIGDRRPVKFTVVDGSGAERVVGEDGKEVDNARVGGV